MSSNGTVLVVTGDTFIGLAIIRSLGRHGIRVVAASCDPTGIGRYSRYCAESLKFSRAEDLLDGLPELVRRHGITHLIATSEDLIGLFNERRRLLEQQLCLLFPPREVFDLALYKDRTLALATQLGIPLPRTVYVSTFRDIERCATMTFPVVLKPRHRDKRQGSGRVLPFKVDYAYSFEELVAKMDRFEARGEYPLIQEYWPGVGVGVELLVRHGRPVVAFQHRRIREFPPAGGVSVYCESVALDPTLLDYATRLLGAMQWDGVAMVEFRDGAGRGPALMEVNGRFWGSLPLALHAGADFPYLLYHTSLGESMGHLATPGRVGMKCRSFAGDTKWLLATLRGGATVGMAAVAGYLAAFRPGVTYYGWAADDPVPALIHPLLRARHALATALPFVRWPFTMFSTKGA